MQFGELQIFLISGGRFRLDGGAIFGVIPKALWEMKFSADERNRVGLALNCLLVRSKDYTALIDSGIGERWNDRERENYAIEKGPSLEEGLAAHGVTSADVNALVLSHLRFDHAGGAATRDGRGALRRRFPTPPSTSRPRSSAASAACTSSRGIAMRSEVGQGAGSGSATSAAATKMLHVRAGGVSFSNGRR